MLRTRSLVALALVGGALLAVVLVPALRESFAPGREAEDGPVELFWAQRAGAGGAIDPARWQEAYGQARFQRRLAARAADAFTTTALAWQPVGPYNIGGRVTALTVDATGALWLGAANGGVWKSTNNGVAWTCVSDNSAIMSVGALAVDPSTPGTVYCGTGEANASADAYDGDGLWRTTDGGATWEYVGLAETARIARVLVDPANPQHLLVAAMGRQFSTGPDRGLYRSLDGGATWSKVLYVSDSTGVTDVVMNPAHPDTMFCATWERMRRNTYRRTSGPESGIWRSVDRGATWTRLATGLPTPTDSVGRIALAVAPSRPSTVYASITTGTSLGYAGLGFYRSTDGGTSWSRRTTGGSWSNNFGGFAWYFGDIVADPNNPDHVWSLGVSLYSSSDGGATWGSVNGGLHADQHALWVDPANSSHLFEGNDGGFYWSTTGTSWSHSTNLPISQFYDGDVSASNVNAIYGGLQDNSTVMTTSGPSSYTTIQGGDGFHVLVDPTNTSIVFDEYQNCSSGGGFYRSTNGGPSQGTTSGWTSSDRFGWDTPITINPKNHNVLLAGSQYVYRSGNNGITWAKINATNLTTNPTSQLVYGTLTTLAISPADTSCYWAGTDDGKVWCSGNRGATWTDVSAGLPGRWVTRVVPDPLDPQAAYVTESGFSSDLRTEMIYRTANRGAAWTNISANMPDAPANGLIVDPTDTRTLFLATDVGVWISRDQGGGWSPLGFGLPLQAVFDLKLHASTRRLFAFTHGRSAWSLDLSALPTSTPPTAAPAALALSSPWPNPARGAVQMTLALPRDANVEVSIYDALGRRVSTPHEGPMSAGTHVVRWDGRDARGARAAAGVYFASVRAAGSAVTRRVVIVD